ncbi:MAG: hypothetical protein EPO11_06855 [Gammaproteobacteria bacterium]|nr:MAG: hypothetical protein EPO11_06855 [Gammaproteobacteria bacterium]
MLMAKRHLFLLLSLGSLTSYAADSTQLAMLSPATSQLKPNSAFVLWSGGFTTASENSEIGVQEGQCSTSKTTNTYNFNHSRKFYYYGSCGTDLFTDSCCPSGFYPYLLITVPYVPTTDGKAALEQWTAGMHYQSSPQGDIIYYPMDSSATFNTSSCAYYRVHVDTYAHNGSENVQYGMQVYLTLWCTPEANPTCGRTLPNAC